MRLSRLRHRDDLHFKHLQPPGNLLADMAEAEHDRSASDQRAHRPGTGPAANADPVSLALIVHRERQAARQSKQKRDRVLGDDRRTVPSGAGDGDMSRDAQGYQGFVAGRAAVEPADRAPARPDDFGHFGGIGASIEHEDVGIADRRFEGLQILYDDDLVRPAVEMLEQCLSIHQNGEIHDDAHDRFLCD
jgi:hypothetical protein